MSLLTYAEAIKELLRCHCSPETQPKDIVYSSTEQTIAKAQLAKTIREIEGIWTGKTKQGDYHSDMWEWIQAAKKELVLEGQGGK